jgi:rRNA maturation protein Nop10
MDVETGTSYQKCHTCGRWTVAADLDEGLYCTPACRIRYVRCPVCGRYHLDGSEEICSIACTKLYRFAYNRYVVSEETV